MLWRAVWPAGRRPALRATGYGWPGRGRARELARHRRNRSAASVALVIFYRATVAFELPGVGAVDWSRMRTGSGSPLEIPHLLRRMSEPTDEHDLYSAADRLRCIVIHEHSDSLGECSEHVIPFLIALCGCPRGLPEYEELLLNDDPLARQAVLVLLFRLEYAPEWLHRTVTDVLAVDDHRSVLDLARALLGNPAYHCEGFELVAAALAKRH